MTQPEYDEFSCGVCGQREQDRALISMCTNCGRSFHLNPRNDREGIDCGDVWSGGADDPALQFFCNPCIELVREQAPPMAIPGMPPPPVTAADAPALDAGRAADGGAAADDSAGPPPLPPRARARRRYRRIDQ